MKTTIKICFVDFFPGFNETDNDFIKILRKYYNVVIDQKHPDAVFYSCFGHTHILYDCIRIFYTGECVTPDFNVCDYAIGFDRLEMGDRYIRVPLYRLFEYADRYEKLFQRPVVNEIDENKDFCSFVVSNCFADDIRVKMFEALNKYRKVSSGGRYKNNVGGPVSDKLQFQGQHKFAIAFENTVYDGYATEKLIDAFAAGTIPIYMGDPNIHLDFNEESFVNGHRFNSIEDIVARVKEIDENDDLYIRMLNTNPVISDNRGNLDLESFLCNIFEQDKNLARRRPLSRYSNEYEGMIRRHRFYEDVIYSKIIRLRKIIYRLLHGAI